MWVRVFVWDEGFGPASGTTGCSLIWTAGSRPRPIECVHVGACVSVYVFCKGFGPASGSTGRSLIRTAGSRPQPGLCEQPYATCAVFAWSRAAVATRGSSCHAHAHSSIKHPAAQTPRGPAQGAMRTAAISWGSPRLCANSVMWRAAAEAISRTRSGIKEPSVSVLCVLCVVCCVLCV